MLVGYFFQRTITLFYANRIDSWDWLCLFVMSLSDSNIQLHSRVLTFRKKSIYRWHISIFERNTNCIHFIYLSSHFFFQVSPDDISSPHRVNNDLEYNSDIENKGTRKSKRYASPRGVTGAAKKKVSELK